MSAGRDGTENRADFPGFPLWRNELADVLLSRPSRASTSFRTRWSFRYIAPLSLRGFDGSGMLVDADVVDGRKVECLIERLFAHTSVAYLHAHNARHGCYSGLIERA